MAQPAKRSPQRQEGKLLREARPFGSGSHVTLPINWRGRLVEIRAVRTPRDGAK